MANALDAITKDLDWRESEIASMRLLLSSQITPTQKRTLLRAAWAMLYAHYEGFCKEALTIYFEQISNVKKNCLELPEKIKIFALKKALIGLKNSKTEELIPLISCFKEKHIDAPPSFPEVETQSNLWPNVLQGLLDTADISCTAVTEHQKKLQVLVSRRNDIAHGKDNFIEELSYYLSFEKAVYEVMYELAIQIDNRLGEPPFEAPTKTQELVN